MKAPSAGGIAWTAAISAILIYAYHKGMLPGLKDAKTVVAAE